MNAVVFDLDGTLIDSAPDIHRAVNAALTGEGLDPLSEAQVRGFVGNGAPMLVTRLMEAAGIAGQDRHAALLAAFMAAYHAEPAGQTRLYPGVMDALETLRARGFALGLCTNKPEGLSRLVLDALGLAPFFGAVIGGDTLPVRKPDPVPLAVTFERLGASGGLFVGDSGVDAETASAAGVPFLLHTEGYRHDPVESLAPLAAFSDFADLPGLVARHAVRAA